MTARARTDDLAEDRATKVFQAMFARWTDRADHLLASAPKARRRSRRRAGIVSLSGTAEISVERA